MLIEDKIKELCPLISNVMVVGDDKKYLAAILTYKGEYDLMTGEGEDKLPANIVVALKADGLDVTGKKPS